MSSRLIALCCVALVGFVALPRWASAQTTEDVVNLTFDSVPFTISSAYVVLYSINGTTPTFDGYAALSDIPVGHSTQQVVYSPSADSQTVPADLGGNSPGFFGIAGVYTNGATQGLTVGIDTTEAAAVSGESFATAFGTIIPESTIVGFLQNPPAPTLLNAALQQYVNGFSGQIGPDLISTDNGTGDLVNFSNATVSGTANATIGNVIIGGPGPSTVPLPSAAWSGLMMLAGLAGISALRRSRSRRTA